MNETSYSKNPELVYGLSKEEVESRISQGFVNTNTDVKTKSIPQIISLHLFTLFNAVNLGLAFLVLTTGQFRNLLFIIIVALNLVVGIFQEIRSKLAIDKLSILTSSKVRTLRDGEVVEVATEDLVLGDCILLRHGEQVPADAKVVQGHLRMDESLLTGESRAIEKGCGQMLMSGSFVETGSCVAEIITVGSEGYAARINAQAKFEKPIYSEILATLKGIIKFSTCALIPLGIILFVRTYTHTHMYDRAILSTVAAVVAMIPQGLVLLTSSVMAIASTRLAGKHVLVQQMYCIETLARVNCVCLDKTGTITSGAMEVQGVLPRDGVDVSQVQKACITIAKANAEDANETSLALLSYGKTLGIEGLETKRAIAFSSQRKYSGAQCENGVNYIMGAAQFILEDPDEIEYLTCQVEDINRILVVGKVGQFSNDGEIQGKVEVLGIVSICDEIRPSAAKTIEFFADQGVEVKVISGDDPRTVSAISEKVGIAKASRYIDATSLKTDQDIYEAAGAYQVFGRVTPYQKEKLVSALQAQGKVVAMTGDGVNDVLALKSADCSFAMASGSDAARNVAEVVLADNDFSHMPEIVYEGRRSINNLQRTASLFLVKTIFSVLLAALCIVVPPYPFIPIQMSFFSGLLIGMPSFVLALEPNHDRVEGDFLTKVLTCSLPASITMVAMMIPTFIVRGVWGFEFNVVSTICTMAISSVGIFLIYKLSVPFSLLRKCLFITVITCVVGGMVVFGEIFRFVVLDIPVLVYTAALIILGKFGFDWLYELSGTHPEFVAHLFSGLVKVFGSKQKAK